jgi:hypothetical protein
MGLTLLLIEKATHDPLYLWDINVQNDPQPSKNKNERKKYPPRRVKERDPWVQRPIPYPQEVIKSQDNARFDSFIELIKNLCLQIPLVDALKIPLVACKFLYGRHCYK